MVGREDIEEGIHATKISNNTTKANSTKADSIDDDSSSGEYDSFLRSCQTNSVPTAASPTADDFIENEICRDHDIRPISQSQMVSSRVNFNEKNSEVVPMINTNSSSKKSKNQMNMGDVVSLEKTHLEANSTLCQDENKQGGIMNRRSTFAASKHIHASKSARSRLFASEQNSSVQPGRSFGSLKQIETSGSMRSTAAAIETIVDWRAITIPKTIDFFQRVGIKLIFANVFISIALTSLVLYAFPEVWRARLQGASSSTAVLGGFLSFALVLRTQSCYGRWWEARTMWGKMVSASIHLSGQAQSWFGNDDLLEKFLMHCIIFPYACKAVLRKNPLDDSLEEKPRFLQSEMLSEAELQAIMRYGAPWCCIDTMRRTMFEALQDRNSCELPTEMINGAFLATEQVLFELNLIFGTCLKINNTRMPASYNVFMRSFVIFFFAWASLQWAPTIEWLTPIITGFMVFLINTVIVIGDQMLQPFDLKWSGLPLQKYCVIIENEVMNVSRRHAMFFKCV